MNSRREQQGATITATSFSLHSPDTIALGQRLCYCNSQLQADQLGTLTSLRGHRITGSAIFCFSVSFGGVIDGEPISR